MIVGRLFTYLGQRYEPGSDFDIHSVAESKRPSFIRLYGLSDRPAPRKKKKVRVRRVARKSGASGGTVKKKVRIVRRKK